VHSTIGVMFSATVGFATMPTASPNCRRPIDAGGIDDIPAITNYRSYLELGGLDPTSVFVQPQFKRVAPHWPRVAQWMLRRMLSRDASAASAHRGRRRWLSLYRDD
jgi:hypothetical protein